MADHLTPEQLDQYRRGAAAPDRILEFDDHLSQCEQCRMALEKLVKPLALTQWAAGLGRYENEVEPAEQKKVDAPRVPAEAPARARWPRLLWIPALAAALIVGIVLWKRPDPPPPIVAELRDGGGTLQLDTSGILHTPVGVDQADQALLTEAFKSKSLPLAATPSDLAAPPGTLLGASQPDEFAPIAPLSIMVYSDRPQFRWESLQGALTYEIQVFDSEFHEVDSSGKIRETQWTPAMPLARGALYQWQVTAYTSGESLRVPSPPAPDARFRVLNEETFRKVQGARSMQQHFLAAILLAKAGMKEMARSEMDDVAMLNPGSAMVQQIIAGLEQ